HGPRPIGTDRGHPARRVEPRSLDGTLPHRRTQPERHDVQLQRLTAARAIDHMTLDVADTRHPLRVPIMWGVIVGVVQAASPLAFWWLDPATVYALSLAMIASIYIGFAVSDG